MICGNPGMEVSATFSPLKMCDMVDVGAVVTDDDYVQPVYNPVRLDDTFTVQFTCGYVGQEASATIDVLDNCVYVDVGKIVWGDMHPYVVHNGVNVMFNSDRVYFYRG